MFYIRRTSLTLLLGLTILGCEQSIFQQKHNFVLKEGDILFRDSDCGPLCDAIERVTTGYQGANISHVGIAAKDANGNFIVIEAVSTGVGITPLRSFLERSSDAQGYPKVMVGRLKKAYRHLIPTAVKNALALKGKPYDKVFAIDNGAYYCSELIYEIFLLANHNNPVFELQPMTFKAPDTGKTLQAWQDYFSNLGVPIPEGQPGINPGGISRSPAITIIQPYGNPGSGVRGLK